MSELNKLNDEQIQTISGGAVLTASLDLNGKPEDAGNMIAGIESQDFAQRQTSTKFENINN